MFKKIILFLATVFLCQAKGQIPVSQRLSDSINTKNHEYWPSITANDSILIFNRLINKDGYKNEDFYYSTKDRLGNWTKAKFTVSNTTASGHPHEI